MYNISLKYNRQLLLLLKLAIVGFAFYFIYHKLTTDNLLTFNQLESLFSTLRSKNIWAIILILLLTDANWLLEIYKWRILASIEKKITFFTAFEQCLGSLTASIFTPNRIGEYGAKALYFEKKIRKKIVLLNLIGNISQLIITLLFGVIGFIFIVFTFKFQTPKIDTSKLLIAFGLIVTLYLIRKQLNFFKIKSYLKQIPKNKYYKILAISFLRYTVFSHQFYLLIVLFGVEPNYFTSMPLIFTMYFLASIIPSIAIFDWLIKGSIAVFLFSFLEINELTILSVSLLMWVLNFAIPSLFGSIFVLNFKLIEEE